MGDLLRFVPPDPPLQVVASSPRRPAAAVPADRRPLVTVHLPCDVDLLAAIGQCIAARHPNAASYGTGPTHVLTVPIEEDPRDR